MSSIKNPVIDKFSGDYQFLSNFHPVIVHYEGHAYPSVEHAYQAAKTLNVSLRHPFMKLTAAQAKRLGRNLNLRPDWEQVKFSIMEVLVREKFTTYSDLQHALLATAPSELIEGNTWGDVYWGVCRGRGENHLGKILMRIRLELEPPYDTPPMD